MYGLYNAANLHRLSKDIELHFFEIPKFKKNAHEKLSKMERWLAYFAGKLSKKEAETMGATAIEDAWKATNRFVLNDEEWLSYLNREMAILDYNSDMRASRELGIKQGREQGIEQGIKKGREQGIEQGIEQGKIDMVMEMLRAKQPVSMIAQFSNFSADKIIEIGKKNGIEVT